MGAPAVLVIVRFNPVVPDSSPGGSGPADASGRFTIGENGKNTGLPSGEYKVTFSANVVKGKPTLAGSGGKKAEKEATEKEAVRTSTAIPPKNPASPNPAHHRQRV